MFVCISGMAWSPEVPEVQINVPKNAKNNVYTSRSRSDAYRYMANSLLAEEITCIYDTDTQRKKIQKKSYD